MWNQSDINKYNIVIYIWKNVCLHFKNSVFYNLIEFCLSQSQLVSKIIQLYIFCDYIISAKYIANFD